MIWERESLGLCVPVASGLLAAISNQRLCGES
jgi:hypothetical protein